jgi:hypothetical protein
MNFNANKFLSSSIDDSMVVCFDFDRIGFHPLKVFQNCYNDIINIELSLFILKKTKRFSISLFNGKQSTKLAEIVFYG